MNDQTDVTLEEPKDDAVRKQWILSEKINNRHTLAQIDHMAYSKEHMDESRAHMEYVKITLIIEIIALIVIAFTLVFK